jgi:inner membrane protein
MRWVSHIAIAGSICAVFNPLAVPAAVLGSTAPDWFEYVKQAVNRHQRVKHRGSTHYLAGWVAAMLVAHLVWDWSGWVFWFAAGGAIHWFCDALTVSGAPVGWWSDRRVTLFGGKVKTGDSSETMITVIVVLVCAGLIWMRTTTPGGFLPFFYQWGSYFDRGLIDGLEWRTNRFNVI